MCISAVKQICGQRHKNFLTNTTNSMDSKLMFVLSKKTPNAMFGIRQKLMVYLKIGMEFVG